LKKVNILLTGGLGYIGSHVSVVLLDAGHEVILLDNLSNCKIAVLDRLQDVTKKKLPFIYGDVRDQKFLEALFKENHVDAVIHFAGLKAVGDSVKDPLSYYVNNIQGTISLLRAMQVAQVKKLVFSSSASVYGFPQYLPYDEEHPTSPQSPYGRTKLQIEEILKDVTLSDEGWSIIALRYFNPVGAHESGLIGEDPIGVPNNLMPYLVEVALGRFDEVKIFGGDYPTADGTGIRDYIHIMDLSEGHYLALKYIQKNSGFIALNLGTGSGCSVFNLIRNFEEAAAIKIPHTIVERRGGDIAEYYANPDKANRILGWSARRSISQMCRDEWNWRKNKAIS